VNFKKYEELLDFLEEIWLINLDFIFGMKDRLIKVQKTKRKT